MSDLPYPEPFEFPDAQARRLLQAVNELVAELAAAARAREAAAAPALASFDGRTARDFERLLGEALSRLASRRDQLDAQAAELEAALATARARRQGWS